MDPLHVCISLGPVAVYAILLGLLNLASRPFLTTGSRDLAALGLAISGFVMAGPMELFLPESAAVFFDGYVWLLLGGFYALCVVLLILLVRPRLVIYNISMDQLRPILASTVSDLDQTARWAGECLVLPHLGVQLYLEPFRGLRNVQLISSGPHQSFAGWRRLEEALAAALRRTKISPNPYGVSLILFGLLMVAMVAFYAALESQAITHALREMLRI